MKIDLTDKKTIEDIIELIASKFGAGYTVESFVNVSYGISGSIHQLSGEDPKIVLVSCLILFAALPNTFFVKEYGFSKLDILDVLKDLFNNEVNNPINKRLNDLVNSQSKIVC